MSDSNALSTRRLGLLVLKNLALDEITVHERLLTSYAESMSAEGLAAAAETINRRLGQLRTALQVAEDLLADEDPPGAGDVR